MKNTLRLKGLDCANCASKLEYKIKKIEGVENVSISFMTEKLVYECKEAEKELIMKKIKKIVKREEPDIKVESI